MHRTKAFQWVLVCLLTFGCSGLAFARPPQRISAQISAGDLTPLRQNIHPLAKQATDLGAVSGDQTISDMTLRFTMTDAQQAALTQLLEDQQNPSSARYHQWLTPEQFGAQFGLSTTDLAKASSWLTSQGFTVTQVARGGLFIRFSGSASVVAQAFHTQLHRLSLRGQTHFGNLTAPEIPTAIASVTAGITGLHDFHPQPHHRHMIVPGPADSGASAHFTSSTSGSHFIAPGDFYTIYDESPLLANNINGSGITIAVMGQTDITLSDIATFRSVSGLPANVPTIKLIGSDPGTKTDEVIEAELDVEWSGATAPNASILFVNTTDVIDGSLTQAIDNNLAPIVSISYGTCEASVDLSLLNSYNAMMQMANAQGQTVVSAAGDSGATDCDYDVATATQGLAVDFPAVLPSVTGIGGTMFSEGSGTYWSTTNNSNSGSAYSYIPEAAWNEDSSSGLGSGGGGSSIYFTKPSWQVGTGVPADSSRDVPDVSLNAAAGHDGYLICTPGYCSTGYRDSGGYLDVVGGTSVGAPSFAGILALVEQKTGSRIGNANPTIYSLANSSYYATVFHDVTTGTNASPCVTGTQDCPAGGSIGYSAGVGYDRATGWGSVDVFNLVTDWGLVTPIASATGQAVSTTTLALSSASVTAGTAVTLTATVGSGGPAATPTGSVQFLLDGTNIGSAVALSGKTATYSVDTTSLSGGTHTLGAAYLGDATFAGSKATAELNVTSTTSPDFSLTPSTATVTTASGSAAKGVQFTISALNGFTGNVALSISSTSSTLNAEYNFTVNPVVLSSTQTSATTQLNLYAYAQNTTAGLTGVAVKREPASPWTAAGSGVALAGLLMLVLPRRRKLAGLLMAVLMAGTIFVSGCGSGGSALASGGSSTNISTTPGTYLVKVTATGSSNGTPVTHTATVTFTVQ